MPNLRRARIHRSTVERKFRSGLEDKVIANLEERGIEYAYEPESFDYPKRVRRGLCGKCGSSEVFQIRRYTPDLRVANGFYVEIKGKLTSDTRSRMASFLGRYPGFDLRFLFQRDNWITKKHKSKYSDWARELGIKYHIGDTIPEEWL